MTVCSNEKGDKMENCVIFTNPLYLILLALSIVLMIWSAKTKGRILPVIAYLIAISVCIMGVFNGAGYEELLTVCLPLALVGALTYDGEREDNK